MRIPRFITGGIHPEQLSSAPAVIAGTEFRLGADEAHHLRNVLRRPSGSRIEVFDSALRLSFLCDIVELTESSAVLRVIATLQRPPVPPAHLLIALVRPEICDEIVSKAVEVGVKEIHFFAAERSQERLRGEKIQSRLVRLDRVAEAALKQSGAADLPKIILHRDLNAALQEVPRQTGAEPCRSLRLICMAPAAPSSGPAEDPRRMEQVPAITDYFFPPAGAPGLTADKLEKVTEPVDFYILIGPEGGFTDAEIAAAKHHGYRPASLGANVLRAETAAITALALVQLFYRREKV